MQLDAPPSARPRGSMAARAASSAPVQRRRPVPRKRPREIRAGLIGFGTIGTGVVKLLQRHQRSLDATLGAPLRLVRIADIDTQRDRGVRLPAGMLVGDARRVLEADDIDIVIELMGGYEPARRFVLAAIAGGKSVVTANKALLAVHGREIFDAAARRRVDVGFEASVGGGIPIVRVLREGIVADRTRGVYGIVNGTCNHILSTMSARGTQFADALAEAQAGGLAEADPTFDIDGVDSAHKLVILAALAFGAEVRLREVATEGIRHVEQTDVRYAHELGYVIKLLAIGTSDGRRVAVRVHPALVPSTHVLAGVSGAFNAILVEGEALGPTMYYGLGAGMMPTATAVIADLMEIARNHLSDTAAHVPPLGVPALRRLPLVPMGELRTAYYLRIMVRDRPGVLASIAGILGRHRISIATVIQKERSAAEVVPVVIRTHEARERDVQGALARIRRLAAVKGEPVCLRIAE
jgi:homoserine dehydrogenase